MPTYDYQCRSCQAVTEVIHSMLESGPTTCERCGGELRRVLYPTGIIFKGSGFYKTDSRASSASNGGAASRASAAKSSSGESSSSSPSSSDASSGSSTSASGGGSESGSTKADAASS